MSEDRETFNDDLLANDGDVEHARKRFGPIAFALEDGALCEVFKGYDKIANAKKRESRESGLLAVGLVSGSLMLASAGPILPESSKELHLVVAGLAAVLGLIGAAIGFVGVQHNTRKQDWLQHRMLTERLRQLHFQILIAWAPLIAQVAGTADEKKFTDKRQEELDRFMDDYGKRPDVWFDRTLEDGELEWCWRVDRMPGAPDASAPATEKLIDALTTLRLQHQLDYATKKLKPEADQFWPWPRWQTVVFGRISAAAVGSLITLDVLLFALALFGLIDDVDVLIRWAHVLTIWAAVLALAFRVVEEGLRSQAETERYRQYTSALLQVRAKLKRPDNSVRDKLDALARLEEVAYREMVDFLAANKEARFVM